MRQKKLKISVVMPVYNAAEYLHESIKSILNQTYQNFEFIIVDDASSDKTWQILKTYARKSKKIKLFRNKRNLGVSEAVKKAIDQADGEYIARMDADDIALPSRFEKQIDYLESHPKTVAVGGQCILINKFGQDIGTKTFPTKNEDVYKYIFEFIPLQQPTLMIARKKLPKNFEFYRDGMNTAEEVELIFKLFACGKVENLPDTLLKYRLHDNNTSLKDIKETFLLTLISRVKAIYKYKYKPTVTGVFVTFAQAMVIFLFPKRMSLFFYKTARKILFYKKKEDQENLISAPSLFIPKAYLQ